MSQSERGAGKLTQCAAPSRPGAPQAAVGLGQCCIIGLAKCAQRPPRSFAAEPADLPAVGAALLDAMRADAAGPADGQAAADDPRLAAAAVAVALVEQHGATAADALGGAVPLILGELLPVELEQPLLVSRLVELLALVAAHSPPARAAADAQLAGLFELYLPLALTDRARAAAAPPDQTTAGQLGNIWELDGPRGGGGDAPLPVPGLRGIRRAAAEQLETPRSLAELQLAGGSDAVVFDRLQLCEHALAEAAPAAAAALGRPLPSASAVRAHLSLRLAAVLPTTAGAKQPAEAADLAAAARVCELVLELTAVLCAPALAAVRDELSAWTARNDTFERFAGRVLSAAFKAAAAGGSWLTPLRAAQQLASCAALGPTILAALRAAARATVAEALSGGGEAGPTRQLAAAFAVYADRMRLSTVLRARRVQL